MIRKFAVATLEVIGIDQGGASNLKLGHRHEFQYAPRKGFVYVRSRAISSRTNDNFDTFPAEELRKSWRTFIGKPVFVNHNNQDHTRMRGVIIDAALHEDVAPDGTDDTWVEVLMEVDAVRFPRLAQALIDHDIERTSMGCDVLMSECSVCANLARTPDDYCPHVARMKGQRIRRRNPETGQIEDVLVHEICYGLSFFENSLLVEDPADPTAVTFGLDVRGVQEILSEGKLDPAIKVAESTGGAKMASIKMAEDQTRVPAQVETLRLRECPVCGADAVWNSDGRCNVCGYLPPPRPFREPDTDVAGRVDRSGGWFDPDLVEAPPFKLDAQASATNPVNRSHPATKGQRDNQGAKMSQNQRPSVAAAARQRVAAQQKGQRTNADLAAENARLRERLAQLHKRADEDNPAQPVPEPSQQAPVESEQETINEPERQNVDVETPGGVIPDPISAPGDVQTIGGEITDPILDGTNQTTDLEAPVAGTTQVDPAATEEVVPDTRAETFGEPAYAGDWLNDGSDTVPDIDGNAATGGNEVEASRRARSQRAAMAKVVNRTRDRVWASLRLAQLQVRAGIADDNDIITLGQKIDGSRVSMEQIHAQASTLQQVLAKQGSRQQVPQAPTPGRVTASRRAPSLASVGVPTIGGLQTRDGRNEALFEG